jgi:hypothetical protein
MRPGCTGQVCGWSPAATGASARGSRTPFYPRQSRISWPEVSAADALATAATWGAAQSCGLGKHKGRLRVGLLLVDGNPLDDIGALRRVSAVILNGAIVGKTADIEDGPA